MISIIIIMTIDQLKLSQIKQQLCKWLENINGVNKINEVILFNMNDDEKNDWNNYPNDRTKKSLLHGHL